MRHINEIVVHCSATPEGKHFTVEDIDRWHRQRGWSGIGYHSVIYLDGTRHIGRPIERIGAHVAGRNRTTIGICYIGGLTVEGRRAKDTRTAAQKKGLIDEMAMLIEAVPTIGTISGHRDYANKACPCFDATAEYAGLIAAVRVKAGDDKPEPAALKPDTVRRDFTQSEIDLGEVERYRVRVPMLNFRKGPPNRDGSLARDVGDLPAGTIVMATGDLAGDWIEVVSPAGYEGWVYAPMLEALDA